jgi:hypothetical protein
MLAIPAPATLETNCRRDIVIGSSPERYKANISRSCSLLVGVIYRTEAVNDQVITMASICRAHIFIVPE